MNDTISVVIEETTWLQVVAALAELAAFVLCVYAAGRVVLGARFADADFSLSLALHGAVGAALFSAAAFVLSHLGWLGDSWRWFWLVLALVPLFLCRWRRVALLRRAPRPSLAVSIVLVWLALYALAALRVDPFADPLWYHLLTPRSWWEQGQASFPVHHIISAQSSYWEYFLLWLHVLYAGEAGRGLLLVQLMAQECHVFFGLVFAGVFLFHILRRLFRDQFSENLCWALVLIAMSLNALRGMGQLAKSDWFGVSFAWAGFYLFLSDRKNLCAYLLLGFSVATKFSNIYFVLPLALYARHVRALACLLPLLPIFVRNAVWLGNPFFPLFTSVFPSPLVSQTFVEAMAWNEAPRGAEYVPNLLRNLREIARQSPLLLVALLGSCGLYRERKIFSDAAYLSALWLLALAFSVFMVGKHFDYRLLAVLMVLVVAVGLAFVCVRVVQGAPKAARPLLALLCVGVLWLGDFRWQGAKGLFSFSSPSQELRAHPGMDVYEWIKRHLKPHDKIAVLLEPALYYLQPHPFVRIFEDAELDRLLREAPNADAALAGLRAHGFRYLMISSFHWDNHWNREVLEKLTSFLLRQKQAVVVDSFNAQRRLLDISKIISPDI